MRVGIRTTGRLNAMPFEEVCAWMAEKGFDTIDVSRIDGDMVRTAEAHGVAIGQVDLVAGTELLSEDAGQRAQALDASRESIQRAVDHDVANLFYVAPAPVDPAQGREATFQQWKRTMPDIVDFAESRGATIALEGWPGGSTHHERIGATPEMLRAMFEACPSPAFGINYDPSHLIRLGVDPMRFLKEFGHRAHHVHAKDTVFDQEALYLYGRIKPSFDSPMAFGEGCWRYCIPGEGLADWALIVKRLEDFGYEGVLSIEHEDGRYYGSWELEAEGFVRARAHLKRYMV
ncbi:MAG: sugar phosphate isomerase/epimerase [Gemmatimonadetes bacterium]|nr:sugar phosphate isomerase/epimerase [Gemmatimonadota bacterium]